MDYFFDPNPELELECLSNTFHSGAVVGDELWKKFELIHTPPLSPSRKEDLNLFQFDLDSFFSCQTETPPDSGDEREQPLAGVDCMWSSSSPCLPSTLPSSCASPAKNIQLKYKLSDDTTADKFSQFPFSLNEPFPFAVQQRVSLKRPSDSDLDEEEVDVVSVEPQNRVHSSPQKPIVSHIRSERSAPLVRRAEPTAISRPPALSNPTALRPPPAKRARRDRSRLNSGDDDSDESKRATHNVLERRRREDLKLLYTNLRRSLPELATNERAAKVKILEYAFQNIRQLDSTYVIMKEDEGNHVRRNLALLETYAAVRKRYTAAKAQTCA